MWQRRERGRNKDHSSQKTEAKTPEGDRRSTASKARRFLELAHLTAKFNRVRTPYYTWYFYYLALYLIYKKQE
jgi:hypothetical protein